MKLTETKEGTLIEVFVKPNQPMFSVKLEDGEIIVLCTEEPVKGKVNREIIKALSKLLNADVAIVSGLTSKRKLLLMKNIRRTDVETRLKRVLESASL